MTARIVVFHTEEGTRYCAKCGYHMSPEYSTMTEAVMYALSLGWPIVE
jgi:hypothetical protein